MIEKIAELLNQLDIKAKYIIRPAIQNGLAVSYHFYNDRYAYYGDGDGVDFIQALQVDIFYQRNLNGLDRQIINLFKKYNIRFENSFDSFETLNNVRLYHKVLTFNFLESEVNA